MKIDVQFSESNNDMDAKFGEIQTIHDGANGGSVTHSWNGTILTVTSASGTSSADLKGAKGDKGDKGDPGQPGADGKPGEPGYTPIKGVDYFTEADKTEIAEQAAQLVEVPDSGGNVPGGGGGGCRTLIAEYTHTSNKVYQPTAFDEVTGVFTCPNHGITAYEDGAVIIVPNDGVVYDINKIPGKKNNCWLSVIDENSFAIKNWDYANDTNAKNVDISAFHFEHAWLFSVPNIPVYPRIEIEIYGKLVCTSWLTFNTSLLSSCILGFSNNGSYVDWGRLGYAFGGALGVFKMSSVIDVGENEITASRTALRADPAGGNVVFQDWFGRYRLPNNLDTFNVDYVYSGANDQGVANGLTVKVFRLD